MPTDFDISESAAAIYAQSLLELATSAGQAEAVGGELVELSALWKREPSFAAMMCSAAIDEDVRRESLRRIFGGGRVSPLVLNFLLVLNDKRRSMILPAVCRAYEARLNDQLGRAEARVTTALPLDDAQRTALREQLRRLTGREAVLVEKVDPDVLGGLHVQVADRVYDTSVRRRLAELRGSLLRSVDRNLRGGDRRFVTEG